MGLCMVMMALLGHCTQLGPGSVGDLEGLMNFRSMWRDDLGPDCGATPRKTEEMKEEKRGERQRCASAQDRRT